MSDPSALMQHGQKAQAQRQGLQEYQGDNAGLETGGEVLPATNLSTRETLFAQLSSNPFFTAGFGIVGLTASLAVFRKGFVGLTTLVRRQMLVDLEIPSKDKSYNWFLHWMSAYQRGQLPSSRPASQTHSPGRKSWSTSVLERITPGAHHLAVETHYTQHPNGALSTTFSLVPGPGRHLLNYRNTLISVQRTRDAKHMDLTTGSPFETITLTTLYRSRHIFHHLLSEAQMLAQKLTQGKTVIYTSWVTEWKPFGPARRKRPLESVVLDTGVKEDLLNDMKDFLNSAQWYHDRGIPYRRGYLLHGPPGSGKSSLINALAGELDYDICVINLSERGLTDDRLNHLLTNLPERSFALLEDVDAAFPKSPPKTAAGAAAAGGAVTARAKSDEYGYRGANVTFSGLLNALDGVASGEERVLVLTTNYRERLDEALVRPGRVDREAYIGWATEKQVREMWRRFYAEATAAGADELVGVLREAGLLEGRGGNGKEGKAGRRWEDDGAPRWMYERGVSTAQLQGWFVYNKGDPKGAVDMARKVVVEMVAQGKAGRVLKEEGKGKDGSTGIS